MTRQTHTPDEIAVATLERLGIARARDLAEAGLDPKQVATLRDEGTIEQVARGLYRLPDSGVTEHHGLALVGRKAPTGVACLLSALRFHDLTSQAAYEVWLALPSNARVPKVEYPPIRIVRMSPESIAFGVEEHVVENVPVRVFGPAKTVADCFKFRNRVGLEVALEALKEYRAHGGSMDELWRAAEVCRVQRVMRPYMEAIA